MTLLMILMCSLNAAIYQHGRMYELRRVNDLFRDGSSAVVVNSEFVFFPTTCKTCVSVYSREHGKIGTFGSEFYDEEYTGMHVKVLGVKNDKISIKIDYEPKPLWFEQETSEYVDD